jgi:type IV pilus assembly protein PilF
MNYGRLLCASGKTEQGEQQFLQVVRNKLFAMPEIAYTGAGICARARNDLPLAESYFHQALDANPYAAGTLLELASLSFEQKKFLDARQYLQRYHQRVGYSPGSLDLAIKIEEALGDTRERDKYSRLLEAQLKPSA